MLVIGLDVGTTGVKAVVFDEAGHIVAQSSREYDVTFTPEGEREMSAVALWQSVESVLGKVALACRAEDVAALCVSSFGEAFVPVNAAGEALMPIIVATDKRGEKEYEAAMQIISTGTIGRIAGMPPSPTCSLSKVLYIRDQEPAVYEKTYKFLLIEDYVIYRLCGEAATDYSLAARTMFFDVQNRCWSREILDTLALDASRFSEPMPSGTVVGTLRSDVARDLRLPKAMRVVTGGHDQPCCALGAGVLDKGRAVNSVGTTECITPILDSPLPLSAIVDDQYSYESFVGNPLRQYVTLAYSLSSGLLVQWYFDNFAAAEKANLGKGVYKAFEDEAGKRLTNVYVLPHFVGSGTPTLDYRSRGAIVGLHMGVTRYEVCRAVLESNCYEMRLNVEQLEKASIVLSELAAVGGGSRSELWLRLKADILQKRIVLCECSEAGALGAGILAAVAAGVHKDVRSAVSAMVRYKGAVEPDVTMKAYYDDRFAGYAPLYGELKRVNRHITR